MAASGDGRRWSSRSADDTGQQTDTIRAATGLIRGQLSNVPGTVTQTNRTSFSRRRPLRCVGIVLLPHSATREATGSPGTLSSAQHTAALVRKWPPGPDVRYGLGILRMLRCHDYRSVLLPVHGSGCLESRRIMAATHVFSKECGQNRRIYSLSRHFTAMASTRKDWSCIQITEDR